MYPHFSMHLSFPKLTMNQRKMRRQHKKTVRDRRNVGDKYLRRWNEEAEWRRWRNKKEELERDLSLCNKTLPLALFLHMLHINPLFMKDGDANYSCPTGRGRAELSEGGRNMRLCVQIRVSRPSITVTSSFAFREWAWSHWMVTAEMYW